MNVLNPHAGRPQGEGLRLEGWPLARPSLPPSFETHRLRDVPWGMRSGEDADMIRALKSLT
jgi:hypothetical protein